jgi:sulfur carrier protein
MQITVNGQAHDVDATLTVAELMTLLGFPDRGVALALNGTVVPRTRWHETPLPAAADVEVLTAVQGG